MASKSKFIYNDGSLGMALEAIEAIENDLEGNTERERLILDREWLKKYLEKRPGVRYIRVVKTKREGFTFIHRGYYFDAYLAKRVDPKIGLAVWMLYLVVAKRH